MKNLTGSLPASSASGPAEHAGSVAVKQLRLGLLTALVIGSMIGSGVFSCRRTWPPARAPPQC